MPPRLRQLASHLANLGAVIVGGGAALAVVAGLVWAGFQFVAWAGGEPAPPSAGARRDARPLTDAQAVQAASRVARRGIPALMTGDPRACRWFARSFFDPSTCEREARAVSRDPEPLRYMRQVQRSFRPPRAHAEVLRNGPRAYVVRLRVRGAEAGLVVSRLPGERWRITGSFDAPERRSAR